MRSIIIWVWLRTMLDFIREVLTSLYERLPSEADLEAIGWRSDHEQGSPAVQVTGPGFEPDVVFLTPQERRERNDHAD
jgi:hypothetical protein